MGFGKSKTNASSPSVAPIDLESKQTASIIDIIGEGSIKGLVGGLQGVFLNDTPIQRRDGTYNFSGVSCQFRAGTDNQEVMQGFQGQETLVSVNAKVLASTPVVRAINNSQASYARVTVGVNSLQATYDDGSVSGAGVIFRIEVSRNGGAWTPSGFTYATLSQTGGKYIANQVIGFKVLLTRSIQGASEEWMYDNVQTVTVSYKNLSTGIVETLVSDVSPSSYSTGGSATRVPIINNFKMENAGVSTKSQYTLHYVLDDEVLDLVQGNYELTLPTGWAIQEVYAVTPATLHISGRTNSPYQRSYVVPLPRLAFNDTWQVRVVRVTPDATSERLQDELYWVSYAVGIEQSMPYQDTVLVGLTFDASLFGGSIPSRSYLVEGLEVKVPTNYDPINRTYNEEEGWDGELKTAWTNNPAWVLYDILTNPRYGGGDVLTDADIDAVDFYEAGKYCDGLVPVHPSQKGGALEPRHTFNGTISTAFDLYELARNVAGSFNAVLWTHGNIIRLSMDRPKLPIAHFTQANVLGGIFDYSMPSIDNVSSIIQVRFVDALKDYQEDTYTIESPSLLELVGFKQKEVALLGCTSRGQAVRQARWLMRNEETLYKTVRFSTGLDYSYASIGDLVTVADPSLAKVRLGGRVKSVRFLTSGTLLEMDAPLSFAPDEALTLYIQMYTNEAKTVSCTPATHDGDLLYDEMTPYLLVTETIEGSFWNIQTGLGVLTDGDTNITVPFPMITPHANFTVSTSLIAPQMFVVTGKKENDEPFTYTYECVAYDAGKWDWIERDISDDTVPVTMAGKDIPPVSNLAGRGFYEIVDGIGTKRMLVSWTPSRDTRVYAYRVFWRYDTSISWTMAGETSGSSVLIDSLTERFINVRVDILQLVGGRMRISQGNETRLDFAQGNDTPAAVTGLRFDMKDTTLNLSWNAVPDNDLAHYEIRFSETNTDIWDSSLRVATTPQTSIALAFKAGLYLIKAIDHFGLESLSHTSLQVTAKPIIAFDAIEVLQESPSFEGACTNVIADGGVIVLDDASLGTGYYVFDNAYDLGDVYTSRVTSSILCEMQDTSGWVSKAANFDAIPNVDELASADTIDSQPNFDAIPNVDLVGYIGYTQGMIELQVSLSMDGTTYAPFEEFRDGDYTARAFRFRLVLRSFDGATVASVNGLSVTIDMPERSESKTVTLAPATTHTITFETPFKEIPKVFVTPHDFTSNDAYAISAITRTGFSLYINHHGTPATPHTISWLAVGFGREVV